LTGTTLRRDNPDLIPHVEICLMTSNSPPVRRSAKAQKAIEEAMRAGFESIALHAHLGFKVKSYSSDEARIELSMRPELIGTAIHQRLHGGVIASILDSAAGFAICQAVADKYCDETLEQLGMRFGRIGTIDLRVDFLRQGVGKTFVATGKVIRLGGRIATAHMTLTNAAGEIIATGTASYVVS